MLRFLLGPILALLPKRWRGSLPLLESADWRVPSILSGFAEFLAAVAAMLYWYSYSVTIWVSRGLDVALAGKAGPGVNEQEIGGTHRSHLGKTSREAVGILAACGGEDVNAWKIPPPVLRLSSLAPVRGRHEPNRLGVRARTRASRL